MSAESEENRLPFEPNKKRKKASKASKQTQQPSVQSKKESVEKPQGKMYTKEEMAIPKVVSQRMIRRVAFFSGVPSALGILTLVSGYLLISVAKVELPPLLILLVNMGLFGLGVIGITYGVLSASWDEDRVGGLLGFSELGVNFGRMVEAWRETRQKNV
jgi:Photosynthesis affected mutant 68